MGANLAKGVRLGCPREGARHGESEVCERDDDVAEVAARFASDCTRMVTGQSLRVDAGEKLG
jgi:NAD(P)-dependent dehydrogenase (short-subunit alcohol dehydrogenase family)